MKKTKNQPMTVAQANLEIRLEALPDVTRGRARVWTKEQDDLILKYVPTKGQPAVAAILNLKYETVRRRYKELRDRA